MRLSFAVLLFEGHLRNMWKRKLCVETVIILQVRSNKVELCVQKVIMSIHQSVHPSTLLCSDTGNYTHVFEQPKPHRSGMRVPRFQHFASSVSLSLLGVAQFPPPSLEIFLQAKNSWSLLLQSHDQGQSHAMCHWPELYAWLVELCGFYDVFIDKWKHIKKTLKASKGYEALRFQPRHVDVECDFDQENVSPRSVFGSWANSF